MLYHSIDMILAFFGLLFVLHLRVQYASMVKAHYDLVYLFRIKIEE